MQSLEAYLVSDSKHADPVAQAVGRDPAVRRLLFLCSELSAEIEIRFGPDGGFRIEGFIREMPMGQPIIGARVTVDAADESASTDSHGRLRMQHLFETTRPTLRIATDSVEVDCQLPGLNGGQEGPISSYQ